MTFKHTKLKTAYSGYDHHFITSIVHDDIPWRAFNPAGIILDILFYDFKRDIVRHSAYLKYASNLCHSYILYSSIQGYDFHTLASPLIYIITGEAVK
jgi:hypothetical protein